MSLIWRLRDISQQLELLTTATAKTQRTFFNLVSGIVAINQELRINKQYELSDAIRKLLSDNDITIIQGTKGMPYEQIEKRYHQQGLQQPPIGDTWKMKD